MEDFLTIIEAGEFVGLSRPTFNSRRAELNFSEVASGSKTLIPKSELLSLYARENLSQSISNLVLTESQGLHSFFIDANTVDLRGLNLVDAYGVVSLMTASASILEANRPLYLILSDSFATRILNGAGYFSELQRRFKGAVHWNKGGFPRESELQKPFLSLHHLAVRGKERKLLDDLVPLLMTQGFTTEMVGYFGWVIGELADNSLTHAQGPCYVLMGQFGSENKFLQIAIGDTGKGIFNSLKKNPKYSELSDRHAFLKAFQSRVTSWPDDKERGKGLSDLLAIGMGNGSILRVDSNSLGMFFNFTNGQRELIQMDPVSKKSGTRVCALLINDHFKPVSREVVDSFVTQEMKNV